MAVVSASVSQTIEKYDFYIERDTIVRKKHRPGNAEDLPEFCLFFEKFGKFRPVDTDNFYSVKIGAEYYVLLCGKYL